MSPAIAPQPAASPASVGATGAIDESTIAAAEKLYGITYTHEERALIVADQETIVDFYRGRREISFPNALPPATLFDPRLSVPATPIAPKINLPPRSIAPLPKDERDIAFASASELGGWLKSRAITSEKLTEIYLHRLETIGKKLECVITLTPDLARAQAKAADAEIAAGKYRGPLHGIPWGAKDLLDTAGIATTWGAKPFEKRVPKTDATVVKRLAEAGAVLVAKLSLGELAKDDVWFGGRTKNPWNVLEGSGGSSAGPASATAAGLVGFSMGSETLGSIVAPSMRCGTTGLRPTFGRVPRTGAMALCWSLDKLGPIARTVEDALLVLAAIQGPDGLDAGVWPAPLEVASRGDVKGLRAGYMHSWFTEKGNEPLDLSILEVAKKIGLQLVEIDLPKWPYGVMTNIVAAESGAAFEELVLSNQDDLLSEQHKGACPNYLREARFLSAVDLIQAERMRRRTMELMRDVFSKVDVLIGPSFAGGMLVITNMTGHPSLTLPIGFVDREPTGQEADAERPANAPPIGTKQPMPRGITVWGRLFDEGTLCRVGMALEAELNVGNKRPPGL